MTKHERIVVVDVDGVTSVRFNDERIVDSANIETMGDELASLVDEDHLKYILLNFEGVGFMSSAAFNKLILLNNKVREVGGTLRLCNLTAEILEAFSILRLDQVFDIRKSYNEALRAFGVTPS